MQKARNEALHANLTTYNPIRYVLGLLELEGHIIFLPLIYSVLTLG